MGAYLWILAIQIHPDSVGSSSAQAVGKTNACNRPHSEETGPLDRINVDIEQLSVAPLYRGRGCYCAPLDIYCLGWKIGCGFRGLDDEGQRPLQVKAASVGN